MISDLQSCWTVPDEVHGLGKSSSIYTRFQPKQNKWCYRAAILQRQVQPDKFRCYAVVLDLRIHYVDRASPVKSVEDVTHFYRTVQVSIVRSDFHLDSFQRHTVAHSQFKDSLGKCWFYLFIERCLCITPDVQPDHPYFLPNPCAIRPPLFIDEKLEYGKTNVLSFFTDVSLDFRELLYHYCSFGPVLSESLWKGILH